MAISNRCAGAVYTSICARLAAGIVLAAAAGLSQAEADVIYTWTTLSETVNGMPSNLPASGQIVLTDAGFAAGSVSVTTSPPPLFSQTLNGVVSANFQAFDGPTLRTGTSNVVNFTATVNGLFLDVNPINIAGGFFVNANDTDAYFGIAGPGPHVLTIGYGTDNQGSVCYGPQQPSSSHCVVTGFFALAQIAVPEPGSLAMLATAFTVFGGICFARRRNNTIAKTV